MRIIWLGGFIDDYFDASHAGGSALQRNCVVPLHRFLGLVIETPTVQMARSKSLSLKFGLILPAFHLAVRVRLADR